MANRFGALLVVGVALAGCQKLGGESHGDCADAGASAGGGEAANAADVARFSDENPFGPSATIVKDKTVIRKAPGGEAVATLPAGTDVTKISARGTDDLVCFDDPKSGKHMMGWVSEVLLQDTAPPPSPQPAVDADVAPPTPPSPTPHGHHHKSHRGHRPQQQ